MHKVYIPWLFECGILLIAILHDGMFAYLLRLTKFTLIAEKAEALSCEVFNRSYIRHGYPISSEILEFKFTAEMFGAPLSSEDLNRLSAVDANLRPYNKAL